MTQNELDRLAFDTYVECSLSAASAAHQLGVSASTVRNRVRRHSLRQSAAHERPAVFGAPELAEVQRDYARAIDPELSPLARVTAIEALRATLRRYQAALVRDARRQDGASWQDIADALGGISRQAAQQRYKTAHYRG